MKNKKAIIFIITAVLVVLIDQLTKFFIKNSMQLGQSITLIKNVLHLTYIHNRGAAFGILQGQQTALIWFSIIVIGIIIFYYEKIPEKINIFTALIFGGIVGNLIDRIAFRYVIDFIDFRIWPSFNIADSAATIGVIALIVYLIKKSK